jgi:conjugative transposon TraM protein
MSNNQGNNKQGLSPDQQQKLKKYIVFALMFIIFGASMWLIFAPSADDKAKEAELSGFNTDIPMPKNEVIIGDKRDAYEQEQMKEKQAERMRSLADFGSLLGENSSKPSLVVNIDDEEETADNDRQKQSPALRSSPSIQNSASAYHDINKTLGSFYETPQEDPEKEKLQRELDELKSQMDDSETQKAIDKQLMLMEKSFQMASKYLPVSIGNDTSAMSAKGSSTGKTIITPVTQVSEQIVSALPQDISRDDILKAFSQPRNLGFHTVGSALKNVSKNTISACIHNDQTITDGQLVKLRMLEPIQAANKVIPQHTVISGTAKTTGRTHECYRQFFRT